MTNTQLTGMESLGVVPKFEQKHYLVQMRFNQEHAQTPGLYWRVIVDGVEHKARSVRVFTPMQTEEFEKAGEMKGNVFTRGWPQFDDERNVVIQFP